MSLINKYFWFKQGIITKYTTEDIQRLFKTKLTEDQIMLIDIINQKTETGFIVLLLIYIILSVCAGFIGGLSYAGYFHI